MDPLMVFDLNYYVKTRRVITSCKNIYKTRMMTSTSSEVFEKTLSQRMIDNTVNKKIISGKTDKVSY